MTIKWKRQGTGYYTARGYSGQALTIRRGNDGVWALFSNDRFNAIGRATTLRNLREFAEHLFG